MADRLAPEQSDSLGDAPEPSENPVLIGHSNVVDALAAAYSAGKLHHALLFAGPRGVGKATAAFHFANHLLNHPDPATAPERVAHPLDARSPTFRMIAIGAHPSVLHLTRPFDEKRKVFKTAITADEIRRVSRFLGLTSHDGSTRIVIIDPADDMNRNAANAILKSLEEPPKRTVFILIAHQPGRLIATIRSRCRMVRFQPLADEDLAGVLSSVGGIETPEQDLIAEAEGSARNAFLLALGGGLDIARTISAILAGSRFDVGLSHKLADGMTARTQTVAFSIFNRTFLDRIASHAAEAAVSGRSRDADALATLWQDSERTINEADAFNLDKRQHIVGLLMKAHEAVATKS